MYVKWILLILVICNVKSEILRNETRHFNNTYASVLAGALRAQKWDSQEEPCFNIMLEILDNADNFTLWAVWILDSLQSPFGHLYGQLYHWGNYDECLNPRRGFLPDPEVPKTQYCLVDITLTDTENIVKVVDYVWTDHNATTYAYLKKRSKHGRILSNLSWGVCVPEVCQPSSIDKITRSLLQISHLGPLGDTAGVKTSHCESANTLTTSSTTVSMIFIKMFLFLSVTTLLSTFYVNKRKAVSSSFVGELAHSFCLRRNIQSLTVVRDEEVYSMNFLRVATCFLVVNVHYVMFIFFLFAYDGLEAESLFEEIGHFITHADVLVDTFLALSGLLFTRGILSDKWQNPLKFIWKRYIRLVAALSAIIFYMATISGQLGDGPLWHIAINEQNICIENWWSNLLMLGNVIHINKMCLLSTWYVPCDYQISVFATILFLVYKQNKSLGKYAFFIAFVLSLLIPGILTYVNDYPALSFYGVASAANLLWRTDQEIWWNIYVPSYCRAGPFIVGMAMGYTIYAYKPKNYRKIIGKLSSHVAVLFAIGLMLAVLISGHYYYSVYEPISSAIYAAVNRTVWGLAVCIIIGVSEYGDVSLLNSMFSWSPLVPLSRLTYGVYLTHMPILFYTFLSLRTTYGVNKFNLVMSSTGLVAFGFTASFLVWLLVEAPLININNMLLDHTWKNKTAKSIEESSNVIKKIL